MNGQRTIRMMAPLCLMIFSLLSSQLFAQPANDNVCNASTVVVDGLSVVVDNTNATVEAGEQAIVPPRGLCEGPVSWCDNNGAGAASIDNSVWFTFTAPASGAVDISLCLADFDCQLALYEVGNCNDFSSFSLITASDDEPGCGTGGAANFASSITQGCLTPNMPYYVLVDGYLLGATPLVGLVEISISSQPAVASPVQIDSIIVTNPICQGDTNGFTTIALTGGAQPFSYTWSTGDTIESPLLAAGSPTVTVTDFCGTQDTLTIDVIDPPINSNIVVTTQFITDPSGCGADTVGGQIILGASGGTAPYTFAWSTGDSTGILSDQSAGTYTVSVGDQCITNVVVNEYSLGYSVSAGPDQTIGCGPPAQLAAAISGGSLGEVSRISYSPDKELFGGVFCNAGGFVAQNSVYRAYNFDDDFGLTGTVEVLGFEVYIDAISNSDSVLFQEITFALGISDTTDLSVAVIADVVRQTYRIPNTDGFQKVFIPLQGTFNASDIAVLEVTTNSESGDGHRFDLGSNDSSSVPGVDSYLSSTDCGLSITALLNISGFVNKPIMDVIIQEQGGGLGFVWNDPQNILVDPNDLNSNVTGPGTLTLVGTDNACGEIYTDTVVIYEAPDIEAEPQVTNASTNGTSDGRIDITVVGGTLPVTFQWSTGDTTSFSLNGVAAGSYCVTITDVNGCTNDTCATVGFDMDTTTSIAGILANSNIRIYPNPGNGLFYLEAPELRGNVNLQLFDARGKLHFRGQVVLAGQPNYSMDFSHLAKGVYILQLQSAAESRAIRLMIH